MSSQQPELAPPQDDGAENLRLLTRLIDNVEQRVDAEDIKNALRGAQQVPAASDPWGLITEAAARTGLRVTRLAQPLERARELLTTGTLLTRGAQGWLLVIGAQGDDLRAYRAQSDAEVTLSPEELLQEVGASDPTAAIQWATLQSLTPAAPASPAAATVSPARRVLRLFAADRADVRTLVIFSVAVGFLNLATPVAVEALVNTVAFVGLLQPIVILALVLALCLGLAAVIRGMEAVVVELIQRRVFVRVATDLAFRLPRVRGDALDGAHGPELVNRFFDITTVQKVGSKLLLDGITAALSAAIGLLVLAFYHPLLLAFDVLLLASLFVIVFVLGRGSVKTALKESSSKYAVADWLEELVRHPLAFHLAGGRELALDHADTLSNTYLERRKAHYKIVLRQLISALALQVVTSTLLLGLGGWLVKIGELTLGQLVASWLIVSLVLAAVAKLGRQLEAVYDLLAAGDKLGVLFDLPLEDEGGEEAPQGPGPAAIRLSGVGHTWPRGGEPFQGVTLDVRPGETLALYGPSGSGKSTLLELLQGHRPCGRGQIEFDGVDLRSLRAASLRPQVGLARAGEVIRASVIENVRLGRPLSLEQVQTALRAVGLWDAVQDLSDGLATKLTSYGRPLSEGQAGLLVLARVIASRPRLILVDGALDGLDDDALERVAGHLKGERLEGAPLQGEPPWTLLVATRRADVARRFGRRLDLGRHGLTEVNA